MYLDLKFQLFKDKQQNFNFILLFSCTLRLMKTKKKSSRFSRWIENLAVDFPHILMLLVFMSVTIRIGQNFQNVESLESYIFAEKALFV